MRYRDETFYWSYQRGVGWPDDYIGPDSMTNFEDIVNRRVNIQEDIKRYQDTLSYTSSKVDYGIGKVFTCYQVT